MGSRLTRPHDHALTPLDRLAAHYGTQHLPAAEQAPVDQRQRTRTPATEGPCWWFLRVSSPRGSTPLRRLARFFGPLSTQSMRNVPRWMGRVLWNPAKFALGVAPMSENPPPRITPLPDGVIA